VVIPGPHRGAGAEETTVRIPRAVRDWAPRKGAKINGVPERYGFAVVVIAVAVLVAAVLLLAR
jgi:hypothetical protein